MESIQKRVITVRKRCRAQHRGVGWSPTKMRVHSMADTAVRNSCRGGGGGGGVHSGEVQ